VLSVGGNPRAYAQHPVQNGVAVTEKASPADYFVDAIGVNTHITYTQSNYANFSAVLQALQELGVRHIRDGYVPTAAWGTTYPGKSPYYADHRALANAGIHTDYSVNCFVNGALPSASDIVAFAKLVGDMDAIEAANEPDDNSGCIQNGATVWQTNAAAQLSVLHTAASTLKVPLYGPAMVYAGSAGEIGSQSANVTDCKFLQWRAPAGDQQLGPGAWGSEWLWLCRNPVVDGPGNAADAERLRARATMRDHGDRFLRLSCNLDSLPGNGSRGGNLPPAHRDGGLCMGHSAHLSFRTDGVCG
jgi:hypothetical protein